LSLMEPPYGAGADGGSGLTVAKNGTSDCLPAFGILVNHRWSSPVSVGNQNGDAQSSLGLDDLDWPFAGRFIQSNYSHPNNWMRSPLLDKQLKLMATSRAARQYDRMLMNRFRASKYWPVYDLVFQLSRTLDRFDEDAVIEPSWSGIPNVTQYFGLAGFNTVSSGVWDATMPAWTVDDAVTDMNSLRDHIVGGFGQYWWYPGGDVAHPYISADLRDLVYHVMFLTSSSGLSFKGIYVVGYANVRPVDDYRFPVVSGSAYISSTVPISTDTPCTGDSCTADQLSGAPGRSGHSIKGHSYPFPPASSYAPVTPTPGGGLSSPYPPPGHSIIVPVTPPPPPPPGYPPPPHGSSHGGSIPHGSSHPGTSGFPSGPCPPSETVILATCPTYYYIKIKIAGDGATGTASAKNNGIDPLWDSWDVAFIDTTTVPDGAVTITAAIYQYYDDMSRCQWGIYMTVSDGGDLNCDALFITQYPDPFSACPPPGKTHYHLVNATDYGYDTDCAVDSLYSISIDSITTSL